MTRLNIMRRPIGLGLLAGAFAVVGGLLLAFGGPVLASAALLAALVGYVVLRDIEMGFWAVIIVICLLPFATIPVDLGITPTFLDVALGTVVGIWLLGLITGKQQRVVTTPITLPLAIFMIVAVFSFVFGLNNGPLTPNLLRHFAELILSLGFVIILIDHCSERSKLLRLVKILLLAGSAASVVAIGLWLLPDELTNTILNYLQRIGYPGGWVIRYIEENPELSERAIGTSVDPNVLGGLLLMIGSLAGPQLVARKPLFPRWQAAVITSSIVVGLILTFSRGAMLGLLAGLGLVIAVRYRRLLPYVLAVGLLVLLLPTTQAYVARFVEGFQGQDLATQMRFGEYKDALTLIGRYPVFGVGFAGTPDVDIYLGVANVYFTIAQMMGLVGLFVFLVLMVVLFSYAFASRSGFDRDDSLDAVWLGLHAALVGGLAAGIFDHYLFNLEFHHAVTAFWLIAGLALATSRLGRLEQEGESAQAEPA